MYCQETLEKLNREADRKWNEWRERVCQAKPGRPCGCHFCRDYPFPSGKDASGKDAMGASRQREEDLMAILSEYREASKQLSNQDMFTGMAGATKLKILDSSPIPGSSADRLRKKERGKP